MGTCSDRGGVIKRIFIHRSVGLKSIIDHCTAALKSGNFNSSEQSHSRQWYPKKGIMKGLYRGVDCSGFKVQRYNPVSLTVKNDTS